MSRNLARSASKAKSALLALRAKLLHSRWRNGFDDRHFLGLFARAEHVHRTVGGAGRQVSGIESERETAPKRLGDLVLHQLDAGFCIPLTELAALVQSSDEFAVGRYLNH